MRLTHWLLGIALGLFVGGLMLEIGTLVVLLLLPTLVWAAREDARPLGSGGVLVGAGAAIAGLLGWADARCAADPSCSLGSDPTPFFVLALASVLAGAALSLLALRRSRLASM